MVADCKVNKKPTKYITQLNIEKNVHLNNFSSLECELVENRKIQGDLNRELEPMKKSVRIFNSGSSKN